MDIQSLLALLTFTFVATASPGPNNIMLMASGANIGFWRTLPHMLGILIGFSIMVILVGIGLMGVFTRYPAIQQGLQVVSIAYLLYLAVKIATKGRSNGLPQYQAMSFWAAANFQWINPKAWTMAISAISLFNPQGNWFGVLLVSGCFALVTLPSVCIWTLAGKRLQRILTHPHHVTYFNYSMAALLVSSTLLMV